ncbi:hypothetical protein NX862_11320 [Rhodobacter sp. KR11]|uniref:calcium-binding protein n=1 Tax=Rhodobacter sp. KR11 TaxID=2974588 RepID=UPI0022215759|nr:calcium-binding protein [Rhodobacter sp. KR11]MCW1919346.1 hypothetical protein [Rhodobacter sp. KR11]
MTKFNLTDADDFFPALAGLTDGHDLIYGNAGNDTIEGGKGQDTLWGDLGNDILRGGAGHDLLYGGPGVNELWGGSGNDTVIAVYDAQFAALQGGTGVDALGLIMSDTVDAPAKIVVSGLNNGFLVSLDGRVISANAFEQLFVESGRALEFVGGAEQDEVVSWGAKSRISLGAGDDRLFIERTTAIKGQADTLDGGAGNDLLQVDVTNLGSRIYVSFDATGAGKYSFINGVNSGFTGFERLEIIGGDAGDRVQMGAQAIALFAEGREGLTTDNDLFEGGALNDVLKGGSGADTLRGALGNDVLIGGTGADILTGGAGADMFVFQGTAQSALGAADRIMDFASAAMVGTAGGWDMLDLTEARLAAGLTETLVLIGTGAFTAAGQIRLVDLGADLAVDVNLTGVTGAEMRVILMGVADATMIGVQDFFG